MASIILNFFELFQVIPVFVKKDPPSEKNLLGNDSLVNNYTGEEYSGEE
jgi:hypothetical protein